MCDHTLVSPIPSEYNSISTGTASGIHILVTQDRKLVIWSSIWEGEALVVFVLVRIFVAAHCASVLVVAVALLHSGVDVVLGVACVAASFSALALADVRSRGKTWRKRDEHDGEGW